MLHVMDFPGCERPVQHGIDPGMTLPSTDPRREVVDGTEGGNAQRYTVHAGLEHLVTAVADDRQHMFVPLLTWCKAHASTHRQSRRVFSAE